MLGTGSLIIDVQGEDDSLTLEYMRKPAVVQRVINSQINEIVGGGRREADPGGHAAARSLRRRADDATTTRRTTHDDAHDTPPFGVGGAGPRRARLAAEPAPAGSAAPPRRAPCPSRYGDRLIELDDLRRRGILSEEEFAAKKSELLNRI